MKQTGSKLLVIICVVMSGLLGIACSAAEGKTQVTQRGTVGSGNVQNQRQGNGQQQGNGQRLPWSSVKSWAYWLDNPDLTQLEASSVDLLVIDYSADGSAARAFRPQQIESLRRARQQRRVVAYLSIGEAETYRGYWQKGWRPGAPDWLGTENPDWHGNYRVKYWEPAWQQIICRYLDTIITAGFDGVYLDRIDAYQENYAAGHENDMVSFVDNLAHYAYAHAPLGQDFGILVQNAEELASKHPDYLRLVTGIGREETYVRATNLPTSAAEQASVERDLDLFLHNSRGKLVLTVDYATNPDLICRAYTSSQARGYVPYVTQVDLNSLQAIPTCQ